MLLSLLVFAVLTIYSAVPGLMESKIGKEGEQRASYRINLPASEYSVPENKNSDIGQKGYFPRKRRKRVAKIIGYGVLRGMQAVKHLLRGTTEIPSHSMYFKQYEKRGGYSQTLRDFESLKPIHVENFDLPGLVEGKTGRVGDRTILIESTGDLNKPQMDIIHRHGTQYERFIRIIYTD